MDRPEAQSGDGATARDFTNSSVGVVDAVIVAGEADPAEKPKVKEFVGRSPGQLAWIRLKRDRTGMISLYVLIAVFLIAILAPVIQWLYGGAPELGHSELLDLKGRPTGYNGGISGDHWLGLRPERGQDVLLQLVFGIRTSLGIAVVASLVATGIGVVVGVVAGYARGWLDKTLSWFIDVMLAFPFFLFALAIIPSVYLMLQDQHGVAVWKKILVIIMIFTIFGWLYTARIVRGQVISLREREYVEAARAAGAGTGHILFKQILPNLWAPILVTFSLGVPATITAEAALAIFGIGISPGDNVADLGEFVAFSVRWISNWELVPGTAWLPGLTVFGIVLAFNLFGDSLRDALDPKSQR
jgi:peptide/nickel transport system permease protein